MTRKYKTFFLIITLFTIFIIQIVDAKRLSLENHVVTIDPGHGGRDPGTRYGNLLEKDLNLEISKVLKKELEKQGAIVYLIRKEDIDLSKESDYRKKRGDLQRRINLIESKKSDIYLSIHLNWYYDYYYGGAEILYNDINKKNEKLASILRKSLLVSKIKTREISTTDLYLYSNTKVPGVLIECGFLSNKDDRYLLQQKEYQQKFSKAIVLGLMNYFSQET